MAAPNTPMFVPQKAQEGIIQFHKSCYQQQLQNWNIRENMRQIDLAYIREQNWTSKSRQAILANRYGDADKLQDITIPVVMPQVESAVAAQSAMFLTGLPIFESVANPTYEDAALQLNAIISDQSVKGGWVRHLQMFFRDGFKYNLSAVEVGWDSIVTAAVETDLAYSATQGRPKSVQWEGNIIKRLDPYNTIMDTRCHPTLIPTQGEFGGYTELLSRTALKTFINKLPTKIIDNLTRAFESGIGGPGNMAPETFYIPRINPASLLDRNIRATTDWMAWASLSNPNPTINYKNLYELTTLYGRIIPSDFNLKVPAANTPQVWKFYIVNNQVLIYAERQTNAHDMIPILFGVPYEDGLGYQTKSLATNVLPFQQTSSTLLNQSMAASRKAIFDRMVYDPSRIREADINNPNPASKIPVRPAAYGKPVSEAYSQVPFRDDQSADIFQKIQQLASLTDEVSGRNRAQRGMFTKGNRTQAEFDNIMNNAEGRDMLTSQLYEAQVFTPLKEMLKINILQYQGGTTLYSGPEQAQVDIDPVVLRTAILNFKMADGLEPTNKEIDADTLQVAMQTIGSNAAIGSGYNITHAFSYLMKTQGVDLKAFEKSQQQLAYEQATLAWQQTASQVSELAKAATMQIQGVTMDSLQTMIQTLIPPQPTPQQFNYTPGSTEATQNAPAQTPTVLQQVMAATQSAQPVQSQQPTPQSGAQTNGKPTPK
jgi:hypothetical protein